MICFVALKIDEDDRLTLKVGKFGVLVLLLNNNGLALALRSLLLKLGFTTPSVGMAEVGVDRPLEGVAVFDLVPAAETDVGVLVTFNSSSPFNGSLIGVVGVDSVCKKATKA